MYNYEYKEEKSFVATKETKCDHMTSGEIPLFVGQIKF